MKEAGDKRAVERLFPFLLRSRALIVGRDTLARRRNKLQFVLITTDLSAKSRERILADFRQVPIVQRYTTGDLERHFGLSGAKVLGFQRSALARSVYAELKEWRVGAQAAEPGGEVP